MRRIGRIQLSHEQLVFALINGSSRRIGIPTDAGNGARQPAVVIIAWQRCNKLLTARPHIAVALGLPLVRLTESIVRSLGSDPGFRKAKTRIRVNCPTRAGVLYFSRKHGLSCLVLASPARLRAS